MRAKIFIFAIIAIIFSACSLSNNQFNSAEEIIDDQSPICGELNGEHQTFPSYKELIKQGATVVHDGPCYGD